MIIFNRVFDDDSKIVFSNNMERRLDGDFITKMGVGKKITKLATHVQCLKLLFLKSTQRL
jgi:hypothetical protein